MLFQAWLGDKSLPTNGTFFLPLSGVVLVHVFLVLEFTGKGFLAEWAEFGRRFETEMALANVDLELLTEFEGGGTLVADMGPREEEEEE